MCHYGIGEQYPCSRSGLECHHIWHPPRWDVVTNLVMLCSGHHDWATDHTIANRMVCMWIKLQKGEFDLEELNRISGKNVLGVIELAANDLPRRSYGAMCATKLLTKLTLGDSCTVSE